MLNCSEDFTFWTGTFANGKCCTFKLCNAGFPNIPLIFKPVASIKQNLEVDLDSLSLFIAGPNTQIREGVFLIQECSANH